MAALAVCPASGAAPVVLRPLTATCLFEAPDLQTDADGITVVTVSSCESLLRTGHPVLPFRTLLLALPPGCTATGVEARALSPSVTLTGTFQVEIAREPSAFPAVVSPKSMLSTLSVPYPHMLAELASVQRMAGYDIAVIRVFPLQYTPALRRLAFAPSVTVEVGLAPAALDQAIPPSPHFSEQQRVRTSVDNPDGAAFSNRPVPFAIGGDPATNYLLITRAALLPSFQPLIAQKQAAGMTVITETMESITNSYAGRDAAERLRTFIRYAYTTWGVGYVLLGGDTKVVPSRGVYARCSGMTYNYMPSDLYFACLDGSWDHNGNSIFGEPNDGETGGDVDLLPEVCVGRAPAETAAEVTNFVARCLTAEQVPISRLKACFAGECLENGNAQGGDALDALTPAFSNSFCSVDWLDDRPVLSATWTASDALAMLNRSPFLVAHFGHGTEYGYDTLVMRLAVPDLDGLTNASPFLLYSTACNTGAFDNNFGLGDCIAEELVKRNTRGAFAVLANSREGWYDQAVESRYSGEYQKRFFDRLLENAQTRIGVAHQLAKQDLLGSVETVGSNMPYRWCLFGLNLFGDPHTAVHVPLSLRFSADHAARVVTWNSWTNRTYAVYRSTDLTAGFNTCIASNVVATPPLNTHTDAVPGLFRAFYRVVAEPK